MAKTALIVDDSATMRQMVGYALRQDGFSIVEGENGQDALERLPAQPVEIIITDVNMPVMDGIAFVQKVRAMPALRSVPILMLTTEAHAGRKEEGRAAGATGWIVKPFDPEKLRRTVAKVVPQAR